MVIAFLMIMFGGMINGSFAMFSQHVKGWAFEKIWLTYGVVGFLLLPAIVSWWVSPDHTILAITSDPLILHAVIWGGVGFGIGQACFAFAINRIGMGLSFLLNIGIGTVLGSLLPLFASRSHVLTHSEWLTILSCGLIVFGLVLCYWAGHQREHDRGTDEVTVALKPYLIGVAAAVFVGFFSAIQNIVFSMSQPLKEQALQQGYSSLAASLVIWPTYLFSAFVPYALYMVYGLRRKRRMMQSMTGHAVAELTTKQSRLNVLFTTLMGIFWYIPLVLYSAASLKIGSFGPIVGWPLFMTCIILSSNLWGWIKHEWRGCSRKVFYFLMTGIVLFLIAVILLALSMQATS